MQTTQLADVTIVGNGILGYATALSLTLLDPSLKIIIIGPEQRDGSASCAAGAMLNCFAEITEKTLTTKASIAKFNLSLRALRMWPDWLRQLNYLTGKNIIINPGTFVMLNNRSGNLDSLNFQAIINGLDQYQEPYEKVTSTTIKEIHPNQNARPLATIYLPNEGYISPHTLLETMHEYFNHCPNIILLNDKAIDFKSIRATSWHITTQTGESVTSKKLLLAAGSATQFLIDKIPELKKRIPMLLSGVGYSLVIKQANTKPIQHVLRTPNRAGACGLHVLPRKENTLYVGASNDVVHKPQIKPSLGMLNFLMKCLFEQINQDLHKSTLYSYHVGNRPVSIDSYPLIGATSFPNLYILSGTYRDGIHQSPLLAQHMAKIILGDVGLFGNTFQPERALIATRTRNEAIEEYVLHFISNCYEQSLQLPITTLTDDVLMNMVRTKAINFYEQLETDFGLPPEIMFMLECDHEYSDRFNYFKQYFKTFKSCSINMT